MRGLGLRQFKDRVSTYHKIIFTFSLEPCTFTELWQVTRIQRNALRIRLKQLIDDGLVLGRVILETGYFKGRSRSSKRRYYFLQGAKDFVFIFRKEFSIGRPPSNYTFHTLFPIRIQKQHKSLVITECRNWEHRHDHGGWPFNLFIELKKSSNYRDWAPYKKIWKIMEEIGY
jgi:hypothetical protein